MSIALHCILKPLAALQIGTNGDEMIMYIVEREQLKYADSEPVWAESAVVSTAVQPQKEN